MGLKSPGGLALVAALLLASASSASQTNLVVATRQLSEAVRLLGVAYIQPDFADFGDLRTLTDASLLIALTDNVGLTLRGEWRRDSRPPGNRKRDDLVFRTGITVSFCSFTAWSEARDLSGFGSTVLNSKQLHGTAQR